MAENTEAEDPAFAPMARVEHDKALLIGDDGGEGWQEVPTTSLVYVGCSLASLAGFLFGYDIGATSVNMASNEDHHSVATCTTAFSLDSSQRSLGSSASLIGATVGCLLVLLVGDRIGRRRELVLAGVLYSGSSLLTALTPTSSFAMLAAARGVYGIGIAFAVHSAPTYISEITPSPMRGTLVALKEAAIVLGMVLGYLLGYLLQDSDEGWRYLYGMAALPSFGLVFACLLPCSPRWIALMAWQNDDEALKRRAVEALRRFRQDSSEGQVLAEMEGIESSLREMNDGQESQLSAIRKYPRAAAAGFGLVVWQQVTGQPSVLYYQTTILKDAGLGGSASLAAALVAGIKLLATLATAFNVERFGRRPMLFIGGGMMAIALLGLSIAWWCSHGALDGTLWEGFVVVFLMLYVTGYQVGFGPITWLILSEVFPLAVRSTALGIAVLLNFSLNLGVTYAYEPIREGLTTHGSFLMYAIITVASLVYIFFLVPETQGCTLEKITAVMRGSEGRAAKGNPGISEQE